MVLQGLRVALLGVGAVGSTLAKSLAKLGPRELLLVDPDTLEPGNLVRHEGHPFQTEKSKAFAVLCALDRALSDCKVFHSNCDVRRGGPQVLEKLRSYDLIVDATGDHGVHAFLADHDELRGNRIAWCYITPGPSCGVLILRASGSRLSCRDADDLVRKNAPPELEAHLGQPEESETQLVWPEPGCYHPTFRASYHRVRMMSDSFVTVILDWLQRQEPTDMITVIVQDTPQGKLGLETRIALQLEV